jgi:hypothetical protein
MRFASPCRRREDAKPHPHACSPAHADLVAGYQGARAAQVQAAQAATHGYATELAEWFAEHGRITFKAWLLGSAR